MRDYAKVSPQFWTGETGKAIRRRGFEGLLVAVYLMTNSRANMLGLYEQPVLFMAHETSIGVEGASKGLRVCIEEGFCSYDEATEMVWVHEMARFQIADSLKSGDNRCKAIQKEYEALPKNPFLGPFFDRYSGAFHMTNRRGDSGSRRAPNEAPSKPLRSQDQEQEQKQEQELLTAGLGKSLDAAGPAVPAASSSDPGGLPEAPPQTVPDRELTRAELWSAGKSLLTQQGMPEKQCGAFVGKLVKDFGEDIVVESVRAAIVQNVADARTWLVKACQARRASAAPGARPARTDEERAAAMAQSTADAMKKLGFGGPPASQQEVFDA